MVILFFLLLMAGCGDGKADAARELAEQEAASTSGATVDLGRFDLPLVVVLPPNGAPENDSLFGQPRWVEDFGHVELHAGPHFGITIAEEEGDMARLRSTLERDMLRTHTILEETPELLVYRQQFPDEDLVFVHFYRIIETQGRTFVVESHGQGRYNESDVALMREAVQPATAS